MRAYRLLLLFFPRQWRRELGDDMARLFDAQYAAARDAGESVAGLWLHAIADASVHGIAERIAAWSSRWQTVSKEMKRWRWWMRALVQDGRYGLRLLAAQPGVTAVAVLTLALGIGANSAIFSAVDAILLRPLPYSDPDRLVMVWEKRPAEGVMNNVVAPADYVDWARLNTVFESMAALLPITADLTGSGEPIRLSSAVVSPSFFDVLRVRPALGRSFIPAEGVAGRHQVVILSHGLWQSRFGSDPAVVGRTILLNSVPHEVVGVLPASFEYPDSAIELWAPLPLEGSSQPQSRSNHQLSVYARMKSGVTLEQARAEMDRVGQQLSQAYPDTNARHGAWVVPLRDELTGPVRTSLLLLLGAVGFVLLIACVNVANLLLARAAARRREIAVRAALGASRGRLIGQALTESLLLSLLGAAAGLLVARWGIDLLRRLTPERLPILGLGQIGLGTNVLIFSLVLAVFTGLLFGLLPAWHFASQDLNDILKDGGRSPGGVRRRLRLALVVCEIALASLLLVGAGLALRSFQTVVRAEAGFHTSGVLTAMVALPESRYRGADPKINAFNTLTERFGAIPGVRSVGGTTLLPLGGLDGRRGIIVENREPVQDSPTRAHPRSVTADYFKTMGIQVVDGRGFTANDRTGAPLVAIVNETMARRYWPGASPVGKRVMLTGTSDWREVVGVVRDVRHWGLDRPVNPEMYMPMPQYLSNWLTFTVATDGDPASVAGAVREQLRTFDPDLPLSNIRTMEDVAARSVASRRSGMLLVGVFGLLALILAAAGIYGVMAHLVALRTGEIGVRITMGARPWDVMRLVLAEGLVQTVLGLAIGLTGGVLLMQSFRTLLYEVSPTDPLTLAAVALALLVTALAACLVPARRAMRVDPVAALRQ
jgi:putative ABC transport system permease protein